MDDSRLSQEAIARLAGARRTVDGIEALGELAQLLNPDSTRRRWAVAGDIAERLASFETAAFARIRRGGRSPRDRLEELLFAVAASALPRDRRNLFNLLG